MNRKLVTLVACAVLAIAALTACGTAQDSGASSSEATSAVSSQGAGYGEVELALFASDEGAPSVLTVRFYDDMPSVPYIGLSQYMALVYGDEAKVEVKDGVATITATDGGVAVVDDAADTLASDSWATFHNYVAPMKEGKTQGFIDYGAPFVHIASLDYEDQADVVVIDFGKYGIDVHVDQDDAYLPISTISDLMAEEGMNSLAYNGKELCLSKGFLEQPGTIDPNWYEPLTNDEARTQDMTDFAYRELCFAVDTLYSCSGKGALDADIAEKGLDATLSEKDEMTQDVQKLLKSTDKGEYAAGLGMLGMLMYNGHTGMVDPAYVAALPQGEGISARMQQAQGELGQKFSQSEYMAPYAAVSTNQTLNIVEQRSAVWADGETYHEQGDTAVISLDSYFNYDIEGWAAYYAGQGERPDGTATPDPVAALVAGLERAQGNPEIKNVVIDVSANGGGSSDLCATTAAIILGKAEFPMRDLVSGQRFTIVYDIDTLFDGTFNTAALSEQYDFNYAVLASARTFSCGNMLTSLMHDAGMPVIGETSGGGTDLVVRMVTPEGLCLQMTDGFGEMTDAEGNNLENGVPVDAELVKVAEDGTRDYSGFYDIAKLSEIVNGYYADK